ncbi:MAG: tetratricopeptide repeat protein [Cyanophyceae cyanobacterium]
MAKKKSLQRFLIVAAGIAFLGSTGFFLLEMFNSPSPTPQQAATSVGEADLASQEQGYELVLEREPENPAALRGLVETRLAMNDLAGAVEPMEKLVKLYPEEEQLQALLNAIKQQAEVQSQPEEAEESQP